MRTLRAVYRHARRFDPDLLPPPTEAVEYKTEYRREKIISDWPAWLAAVPGSISPRT